MLALAFVMGVLIIIPIGGADMPAVVSMLNSYWAGQPRALGFSLNNFYAHHRRLAGRLLRAILSYIMCKAMNRSFFNVILGGFGGDIGHSPAGATAAQRQKWQRRRCSLHHGHAETVVIVPGYGLAVARAQHAVKELATKLTAGG